MTVLTYILLGLGIGIIAGAAIMVIGFALSMPAAVAYAVKEHQEHPEPPNPRTPHYRQLRMHLRTWEWPQFKLPRRSN